MQIERKSSGVAKAGLATGIVGSTLGVLNMAGSGAGLLNTLTGNHCVATTNCGCNEDHLVDRYTLAQEQKIAKLETEIALRDANIYNDQKTLELYKYIDGQISTIQQSLGQQAVQNQKTADSFQIVSERMGCLKNELTEKIENERHERKCADNTIVTYVNATFYPKQIADVTTGSTTTAQNLYNPLPAECCGCGNN